MLLLMLLTTVLPQPALPKGALLPSTSPPTSQSASPLSPNAIVGCREVCPSSVNENNLTCVSAVFIITNKMHLRFLSTVVASQATIWPCGGQSMAKCRRQHFERGRPGGTIIVKRTEIRNVTNVWPRPDLQLGMTASSSTSAIQGYAWVASCACTLRSYHGPSDIVGPSPELSFGDSARICDYHFCDVGHNSSVVGLRGSWGDPRSSRRPHRHKGVDAFPCLATMHTVTCCACARHSASISAIGN